jgi:hypothetical protein
MQRQCTTDEEEVHTTPRITGGAHDKQAAAAVRGKTALWPQAAGES